MTRLDVRRSPWLARAIAALAVVAITLGVAVGRSSANNDDPAVGGEQTEVFAIGQTVVVATDRLKLRADAGLAGEVITVLENGQSATVVDGPVESDGYSWYQLDVEGTLGWSAGAFLAAGDADASDDGSDDVSDASGEISIGGDTAGDDSALPIGSVAVVNDDRVNLRAETGLEAEIVAKLSAGTTATVLDGPADIDGYLWYQLDVDGTVGWTAGDFLAAASTAGDGFAAGAAVIVNDDRVNLRAEAGLDAEILDKLSTGATATVVGGPVESDGYSWYQVEIDGVTGWVAADFLAAA